MGLDLLDKATIKAMADAGVLPDDNPYEVVDRLHTGSVNLDYTLGGGLPVGRITTIVGTKSFGKTTTSLLIAAYVTQHPELPNGGKVCYVDMERTHDWRWAKQLGVNPSRMVVLNKFQYGEQAMDFIVRFLEQDVFDLIIFDSVSQTPMLAEMEGSMMDHHMGVAARKWKGFTRRIKGCLADSHTALLMINHTYQNMALMGSKENEYGGGALGEAASIQIKMLSPEKMKGAIRLRPKTYKNKTAEPGREGSMILNLMSDRKYVDVVPELTSIGKELYIFTDKNGHQAGNGHWYFDGEQITQSGTGEKHAQAALYTDKELRLKVTQRVWEAIEGMNKEIAIDNTETGDIEDEHIETVQPEDDADVGTDTES